MISRKQLEDLQKTSKDVEKIKESIVISDDATLVEIGGNIAIESIEQLGIIGKKLVKCESWDDVKVGETYTCKFPSYDLDLTAIGEYVEGVFDEDSFEPELDDGDIKTRSAGQTKVGFGQSSGPTVFSLLLGVDAEGQYGLAKIPANQTFKIKVTSTDQSPYPITHLYNYMYKEVDAFVPFFTEEQYQALLDLIENA